MLLLMIGLTFDLRLPVIPVVTREEGEATLEVDLDMRPMVTRFLHALPLPYKNISRGRDLSKRLVLHTDWRVPADQLCPSGSSTALRMSFFRVRKSSI